MPTRQQNPTDSRLDLEFDQAFEPLSPLMGCFK